MKLSEKFSLAGKTALVTGSSQGIGKGIAIAFAEYGADIILHYRKDRAEAEAVAKEIKKSGVKTYIVNADLSKAGSAKSIFDQIQKKAKMPDIVVLNASVQIPKLWQETNEKDFEVQVNANFKSTLLLMQYFAPEMISNGWGRILTIGSVQQVKPHPSMIVYAATKSAVLNIVQNVAMQLADKGITVNNLAPGVIDTPRIDQDVPEMEERISKRLETPSGQLGDPQDCAAMAVLLCSEAGRFITGQNIFVDGGMSL
ncbi:SDR family NAD(P)-dependent oxidoreductase [Dyadobacter pollutisoli]|uniref:SDR family NAD(P)-dependent oxidoreductase n=1 Tax=Dyadobacter pollutisoli TaxID=2910158 RepID=A0A9E8SNA7_9BACT|nr:SDR family oxidoreductase [Dyadobacter pollutisoli]WAC15063.1 SDR family NAD(P)-dependent oxidoreductase [Dyadobacter pollutisoli]